MMQLQFDDAQIGAIRRELQESAERLQRRAEQLPELIARHEERLQALRAELTDVTRRLEMLIGDEEAGRPGLVVVINQQIDLFAAEHAPVPSASLGRRGHPAPIAAPQALAS